MPSASQISAGAIRRWSRSRLSSCSCLGRSTSFAGALTLRVCSRSQARLEGPAQAAGALRSLHAGLQRRAASPGARNEVPGAELYVGSSRPYKGLSDLEYPFHNRTTTLTNCGRIRIGRRKINLGTVFAGQNVGITEVSDKVWLVSFMQYDLGFFDHETDRVTSAENPFGAKVLPMCSE
jgi:hypothetical protein